MARDPAAYDEEDEEDFEGLEDLEEEEDVEGQGGDGGADGGPTEGPETAGERQEADEEDGQRRLLRSRETPTRRLSRQLQEEAAARRRLEAELAQMRAAQQPRAQEETAEQEAARMAMMDSEQRSEYRLNKALQRTEAQNRAIQFQMIDQADKSNFATLAAGNQLYAKLSKKVEEKLVELRAKGQNVDRETLAKYLIGDLAVARGPKAISRAKAAGDRNLRRERGRPSAGRSDQSVDRRTAKGKYAHLEDVVF